jgi:nicotinate-nucleotide adenylyltransferase
MTSTRRLGILGGTFDPVHVGHLDCGDAAVDALALDQILLIPAYDQPLRTMDPRANVYHRFAMAALAVADRERWTISDSEVLRRGRSFTADTLRILHDEEDWTALQLFFILGSDAFAGITAWHGYPSFFDLAHFVVIARPGTTLDSATARTPELRGRMADPSDVSAMSGGKPRIFLVHAHTRDVSSTQIRDRLAASLSIDDLVPGAVASHIAKHHLYGAVGRLHGENERI